MSSSSLVPPQLEDALTGAECRHAAQRISTRSAATPSASGAHLVAALYSPPGSAGELAGGRRGASDDRRDVLEGNGKEVMEDEGEPLGGTQRVEHQQQGWAQCVGHNGLVLRGGAVRL